jgi:predicted ATPase
LLEVGHGGPILLTHATEERVRDTLPEEASLRSLGEHRLKDLAAPERVFQLLHRDLPTEFLPLPSLDLLPHNLPLQVTSFVGREKEMAEVRQLLRKTRLLTLTGVGGTGKTRLALQVAADRVGEYPAGLWLAELAPLSDSTLVPQTVATLLGVREEPGRPLTATLVEALKPKKLLVLLDNCEHLLTACAQLADALLRACPGVQVLATSREGLNIPGETTYRLPSLSVPPPTAWAGYPLAGGGRHLPATVENLTQYEAVHLFLDRAATMAPAFTLTDANANAVAQVCCRLDGIPLAIELAAARVKVLSVEKIAQLLDDRFRLLTGGSRTALPRQQTLRALIDWSYDLLSEPERRLLCRLAVFAGGWTLEAASAVGIGDPIEEPEVLDLLTALVERSLVVYEGQEERYRLLETVRQYGRDRLRESGEGEAVRRRHHDFFLTLAEEEGSKLGGPEQLQVLDRLEREHDNLRAALAWSGAQGQGEAGLRLAAALWHFWQVRGYVGEGRENLAGMLALPGAQARTAARAQALHGAGLLASHQGDHRAARALLEESLAICRELGIKEGGAKNLEGLAVVAVAQAQPERAARLFGVAEGLREAIGAPLPPAERAEHERSVAAVRTALGEAAFATAWEAGRARSLEEATRTVYSFGGSPGHRALGSFRTVLLRRYGCRNSVQ